MGMENENPELLKDMDRLREAYSLFLFKNKEIILDFKHEGYLWKPLSTHSTNGSCGNL